MVNAPLLIEAESMLTVVSKRFVSDSVVEITLSGESELPAWTPGAHIDIELPGGLTRQYSLSGDPADRGVFRLGVLREPAGRGGSAYVHDELAVGHEVLVRGPRNHFPLAPSAEYHFIAGGIGITPILPMIERAEADGAVWKLSYLGRSRAGMAYVDELIAAYGDRVEVRPDDEFGFPDLPALLGAVREDVLFYACGPGGLLTALESVVAAWPDPHVLHLERFAPKDRAALTVDRASFTVALELSGGEYEVPADKSILEVLREAGQPVISSCEEGTCGTCETAVISGEVDHRDSVLSDEERAENTCMMICVSRAKAGCPVLVLDA